MAEKKECHLNLTTERKVFSVEMAINGSVGDVVPFIVFFNPPLDRRGTNLVVLYRNCYHLTKLKYAERKKNHFFFRDRVKKDDIFL